MEELEVQECDDAIIWLGGLVKAYSIAKDDATKRQYIEGHTKN